MIRTESKYKAKFRIQARLSSQMQFIINNFSGKISREELTEVLTQHGRMKVSLEEAGDYIAMVDTDSDGMLDYGEFVSLFTTKIGL